MTLVPTARGAEERAVLPDAARIVLIAGSLLLATVAALVLEQWGGVADASPVYLVAVVVAAGLSGTIAAIATSVIAFLGYDFLFTTPRFTFSVSDPAEWVSLLLFLIVAVVIGRLAGLLRERADEAQRRVREGVGLVAISRDVAVAASFEEAAVAVVRRLRSDADLETVWVLDEAREPAVVALAGGVVPPDLPLPWTLMRGAEDGTSTWLRVHGDAEPPRPTPDRPAHYVVEIDASDERDAGAAAIHALRAAGSPHPGRGARRLLALPADQLGVARRRDRLRADLTAAEVTRQSDALRAAILDSVSHDLRTPVASIRALAGGLSDAATDADPADVRRTASAIDAEGARLGELVNGLLDMGRIQAGAVRPDLRPYDLAELVETTLRHPPAHAAAERVVVEIPDELPPVLVDGVLFDVALGNILDNAARHAPAPAAIRVRARAAAGRVEVAVDDAGPGVPAASLPQLFDRFYRVRDAGEPSRHGLGLGLAIARGFVRAMDATIDAAPSDLGGLRITIGLLAAEPEAVP